MATRRIIDHLRRAVLLRDGAGLTDGQLLGLYIDRQDESAFEALVRRHSRMVLGVCRRVLRNHHDSEDVFQATFLVLARKAASLTARERLAGWLHGVAYRTALRARTARSRRRARERQVLFLSELEARSQEREWDLRPLLDQELNRLPEKYRTPVILCDLEGRTHREAARFLGWPAGTLSVRLSRARRMLARRLTRRGIVPDAGTVTASALPQGASAGVPPALVAATVRAAGLSSIEAVAKGLISAEVASLMQGVIRTMFLTKIKIVAAVLLVIGVLGSGTAGLTFRLLASGQQDEARPPQTKASELGRSLFGTVREWDAQRQTITLSVIRSDGAQADVTRPLATDLKVLRLGGTEGRLADVIVNTPVEALLAADARSILEIRIRGNLEDKVRWLEENLALERVQKSELEARMKSLEREVQYFKEGAESASLLTELLITEARARRELEQKVKKLEEQLQSSKK